MRIKNKKQNTLKFKFKSYGIASTECILNIEIR